LEILLRLAVKKHIALVFAAPWGLESALNRYEWNIGQGERLRVEHYAKKEKYSRNTMQI
jgi:hypothetical protein